MLQLIAGDACAILTACAADGHAFFCRSLIDVVEEEEVSGRQWADSSLSVEEEQADSDEYEDDFDTCVAMLL